jgi:hypothetical protein
MAMNWCAIPLLPIGKPVMARELPMLCLIVPRPARLIM